MPATLATGTVKTPAATAPGRQVVDEVRTVDGPRSDAAANAGNFGSGPGGQRAAIASATLGKSVAVVERGRRHGGIPGRRGVQLSDILRGLTAALDVMNKIRALNQFRR
jgi:hypothetical protein